MRKTVLYSGLGLAGLVVLLLLGLRIFGLEPQDQRPGLWLSGEVVQEPVSDWSFTRDAEEIFVQTRTWYGMAHSVTTYCATHDGHLYLFSAYYQGGPFPETRSWNVNVMRDPNVGLKIGGRLFDQSLQHVTDESVRQPVIRAFERKYPQWSNPGDENVHVLRVRPPTEA